MPNVHKSAKYLRWVWWASVGRLVAISQPGFDGYRKNFDSCDLEMDVHSYAAVPIKTSFDFVKIHFESVLMLTVEIKGKTFFIA